MPKDPDKSDWYFEDCPADEVDYCWTYEYARESDTLKKIITKWRQSTKGNKVEDYIALAEEINAEPIFLSVYPFFPCWPHKPYLSIDPKIRKTWLAQIVPLWDLAEDEYWHGIQARYSGRQSTLKMFERFARAGSLSFRTGSSQFVVFGLDWNLHDKRLEAMFHDWLKENRPKDAKASERRGRGNPARRGRANLKYLSAYRILKRMSKDDAKVFLADEGGKLKPYKNYQDWDLAQRKARALIRSLEEGTFILPPWKEGYLGEPISEKLLKAARLG
jgi:hypothetical protein